MTILQNIMFPSTQNCTEEEMYFRKNGKIKYSLADDRIVLKKKAMLSFDTYLNGFSANNWLAYTKVENVRVRLFINGDVRVSLVLHEKTIDGINEKCVYESYFNSETDGAYFDGVFDTPMLGMYSVRILCMSGEAEFISGYYYTTDNLVINDVQLKLIIGLSEHKNYVYKNIQRLERKFLLNQDSLLCGKIQVYVLDEKRMLKKEHFKAEEISIVNTELEKNVLKDLFDTNIGRFEYALLLDEDVIFQMETILKMYVFLSMLKDEYKDIIILGDVFRSDLQWNRWENALNDGGIKLNDMRCLEQCLVNEKQKHLKYDAWWCGIVPCYSFSRGMPAFENETDADVKRTMISFNGLCVWHEKINSLKQSNWFNYYMNLKKEDAVKEKECILQHFLMPQESNCTEESLYFRRGLGVEYSLADEYICLKNNAIINFDTYFNGFSAYKWFKYTSIQNVKVHLNISGKARITLLYKEKTTSGILEKCIYETYFDSETDGDYFVGEYTTELIKGMYCISILSMSDNTKFYGGYYYTVDVETKDIGLAINICTFKREKYVYKNMKMLEKEFLLNKESELHERLYVNIADNAKSLDKSKFRSSHIKVFKNRNLGGAGGFTRAMIESKNMQSVCNLTHVLLMDDDVVMQPESIYRTYRILSLIKPEYENAFIGGAMLRTDLQWYQTEAGGTWNAGQLISHKQGLDLRILDACLYNEVEEKCDFNAWWYCTIPINIITEDNLPMPIFIRGDDVEFGLRNMKHLVLMNGICVWHEPFENKYSSSMYYYIFRNRLIDNAVRGIEYSKEKFLADFKEQYFREVFTLRYKNAQLLLDGVYDFLKGPEWLMEQDGEELNMSIMSKGYKFSDLNDLSIPFDYPQYEQMIHFIESPKDQKKRKLTLNGLFGAHNKSVCVPVQNPHIAYFYKAYGAVNYDVVSGKGFETYFDKKEELALFKEFFKLKRKVKREYDYSKNQYLKNKSIINGKEFWEKYLNIEEKVDNAM